MRRAVRSTEDATVGQDLRERYHRLVDLAPDAILIHDGEVITMANAAAIALAGAQDRHELIGLSVDTILNPPFLKGISAQFANPVPGAKVPAVRDTFRRLDGSAVEVEVTAIPFVDHGRPAAHLVIRDITERLAVQTTVRQALERIQQAEKMEAIGLLAGGVAHEVNNMMVVVQGFSESLLHDPRLPDDLHQDVRQIFNAGERASNVTSQLLSFSRHNIRQPISVPLDTVMQELEPTLRQLLGGHCTLTATRGCPHCVLVDKGNLDQALVNLTLNARDAMPDGGTLTVVTSEATVEPGLLSYAGAPIPDGHYGLITVEDTGTGMEAATLARIFEPFYTTKPLGKGAGLGLAAVYGITRLSGGHVRVESTPGKGTRFALYLPITRDPAAPERRRGPRRETAAGSNGKTVLIVDDEAAVLMISARVLEREGYLVLQASDGAVALDMINQLGPPDLVLTDLMMPGIGGAELARRLSEDWPTVPIVFMSGYSADDLRLQGTINLAVSMLQKPFKPDQLAACVASALHPA